MNLFFNSASSDPASALARSQTNNQPALKPTFVLGDNPEVNIYVTSGDGGFDPASGDATVTPSLGIGTPGAGPSGGTFWLGVSTATSGALTTAKRYQIETYVAGDDFANVGAAENATGVVFTSSGTTPTDWNNGSTLIEITTDVSYSASAATLEAALEATEAVVGVTVTKASSAPNFVVEWDAVGAVALLVGGPSSLTPASAVVTSELQAGSASAVERQIVRLTRQPYALQTVWSTIANGWSARLDCNTRGLLDFLEGEVSAGSTLELQLVDASQNVSTVGQVSCTVRNEAIDEASTIPTPFPSYLTATQVNQNFLQNRFQVTALDGGGTALDGIPTGTTALPTVPTDALVAIELGGDIFFYELVAGTDAESLPDVVRPDDYAASTNERVWLLRAVPSALPLHASTHEDGGTDEISVTGLSGLLADGQTPLTHASTHASAGSDPLTLAQSQVTSLTSDLAAKLPLAGGTMTGQLNFSGTTHAGIKLLSLTTTQRNALTAANGMLIYNTTTATVQKYEAGAWADVGSGSGGYSLTATTTDATQTELLTADAARLTLPDSTAWGFTALFTGRRNGVATAPDVWWSMNEGSASSRVDVVGGYNLSPSGSVPSVAGLVANASNVKFSDGYLERSAGAFVNHAASFTWSGWIKTISGTGGLGVCLVIINTSNDRVSFGFGDNGLSVYFGAELKISNVVVDSIQSESACAFNVWNHWAFTYNHASQVVKLYINGILTTTNVFSNQFPAFATNTALSITAFNSGEECVFDETARFPAVLTASEILYLYNNGLGRSYENTNPPVSETCEFKGHAVRDSGAASMALSSLQENPIGDNTAGRFVCQADTTNGALQFLATGAAAEDWKWGVSVQTVEVTP